MARNKNSRGSGKFIKTGRGVINNPSKGNPTTIFTQVKLSNKSMK